MSIDNTHISSMERDKFVESTQNPGQPAVAAEVSLASKIAGEDQSNDVIKVEERGTPAYFSTAGDNKVIKASAGYLFGILVGEDVANGEIELSNDPADGDGDIVVHIASSTMSGYWPVNASFSAGISADLINQTKVTFFYR